MLCLYLPGYDKTKLETSPNVNSADCPNWSTGIRIEQDFDHWYRLKKKDISNNTMVLVKAKILTIHFL